MQKTLRKSAPLLTLILAGMLATGPVYADEPDWVGNGKEGKGKHESKHEGKNQGDRGNHERGGDRYERDDHQDRAEVRINAYFNDHHREVARAYYDNEFRSGHCPPGLAKKHNGCLPPGQAKKWMRGRPLPRDLIFYDVPTSVVVELGYPPAGHRYVRVAADILMIAIGTGMVVDAIEDIGGR